MKLNREQIVKAIAELRKRGLSNGGALGYHAGWCDEVADILEELTEENERLQASTVDYRNIPYIIAEAKGDTVRKMQEETRQRCIIIGDEEYVTLCDIDQIAQEMLEEEKV